MTTFPGAPRLQRGMLIGVDPFNPLASIVVFQYNPDSLTRTVSAQAAGEHADRGEALRLKGPPQETIKLDVEIDAADQAGETQSHAPIDAIGIHGTLASLEMLLYPKSSLVIANEVLAALGVIEMIPGEAPLTLFVWGAKRSVAVRLTEMTITEEAFDPNLNPIRAKVSLSLRVLTYQDLGLASVGGALFMAHQIAKEAMATIGGATALPAAAASAGLMTGG